MKHERINQGAIDSARKIPDTIQEMCGAIENAARQLETTIPDKEAMEVIRLPFGRYHDGSLYFQVTFY